jgi:predicted KAP-like P-loop ATPase
MFKPDQPIKSHKDDKLDRFSFAQSLGNAILNYKEKDSIVIGLFGAWGSGKTSIINMALEHIDLFSKNKNDDEKPIVIKFNPWNYSDQNQLVTQFFKQLSIVLRRPDHASDAKKAGEQLETYAKFFEPFALIPTVGPFARILSVLIKNIGSATRSWGDLKSNDLNAIRSELNELLGKQPHKIIVVIDDIDRLNNTEIRQIFQLIKSLGNFPNTIYLLAFDMNVVKNALEKVQECSGIEYLEKVVQIPFEIPLISKQEVERLLFSKLDELIKDLPENKWNQNYWINIYNSGLKYFFRNIRDVTRYINSLRFSFEIVKGEVNAIDFLAIIGVQVFFPEVYYGIRDNKDIFAGTFDSSPGRNDTVKEQAKKRCDEIIGRVNESQQEVMKDFLKILFPKLESIYGYSHFGNDWMYNWRRDCRICSPDIFDIFFRFSLPKGEISQKEIETIVSLGNNANSFAEALLKLSEDKRRIIRLLERLEDYTQSDIPEENIEPIITALMDTGDLFPEGDSGIFVTDTPMRILRLCYQLSHRFDSSEKRFNIFNHAIQKATRSLYTIVHEVGVLGQEHGKFSSKESPEPKDKLTVNVEQLEKLEKLACDKIENWAKDGRLKKHEHLLPILFRWKEWGQREKINHFVNSTIKNDDGLIDFIASFLNKHTISHGMSDYVGKIDWRINLKNVEEFVDLKNIELRIRKILSSSDFEELDARKKLAIKTFLDTIDGKIKNTF